MNFSKKAFITIGSLFLISACSVTQHHNSAMLPPAIKQPPKTEILIQDESPSREECLATLCAMEAEAKKSGNGTMIAILRTNKKSFCSGTPPERREMMSFIESFANSSLRAPNGPQ